MNQARRLVAERRYDKALACLSSLPHDLQTDTLRAESWIGKRRLAEAETCLQRALREAPQDGNAMFQLGRAHLLASRPGAAIGVFERLMRQGAPPTPAALAEALASAYRRDARYDDCIALGQNHPPSLDLLYETGLSHVLLSQAEPALAAFDKVFAIKPDHAAGWFNSHAPALESQGLESALARLHNALACEGANTRYWGFIYAYYRLSGHHDEAAALFADKLGNHPKRRALPDSVDATLPHLAPDCRVFGLSGSLLRHGLDQATQSGLVMELGVRRGTSIRHLAAYAGQQVHGFDSFEGLPETWGSQPKGILTTNLELPSVPDNVALHPGWFEDSLPIFLETHPGTLRFANIDSDLYSSAKLALDLLGPRIQPGSVLVFDEFIGNRTWRDDEYRAFMDFAAATGTEFEIFAVNPMTKQVALRILARRDANRA